GSPGRETSRARTKIQRDLHSHESFFVSFFFGKKKKRIHYTATSLFVIFFADYNVIIILHIHEVLHNCFNFIVFLITMSPGLFLFLFLSAKKRNASITQPRVFLLLFLRKKKLKSHYTATSLFISVCILRYS